MIASLLAAGVALVAAAPATSDEPTTDMHRSELLARLAIDFTQAGRTGSFADLMDPSVIPNNPEETLQSLQ